MNGSSCGGVDGLPRSSPGGRETSKELIAAVQKDAEILGLTRSAADEADRGRPSQAGGERGGGCDLGEGRQGEKKTEIDFQGSSLG